MIRWGRKKQARADLTVQEANRLRRQYAVTGNPELLDRSVTLLEEVTRHEPVGGTVLLDLAAALGMRYQITGRIADLDASLRHLTNAARLIPDNDNLPLVHANQIGSHTQRFLLLEDPEDLRAGMAAAEAGLRCRAGSACFQLHVNFSGLLSIRFDRFGEPADMDRSIAMAERAVHLAAGSQEQSVAMVYAALSSRLCSRFRLRHDDRDLDAAIGYAESAVARTERGQREWLSALTVRATAQRLMFERANSLRSLDAAIADFTEVVSGLPDDHAEAGLYWFDLASTYIVRFRRLGSRPDVQAALAALGRALRSQDPSMRRRAFSATAAAEVDLSALLGNAGSVAEARLAARRAVEAARAALRDVPSGDRDLFDGLLVLAKSRMALAATGETAPTLLDDVTADLDAAARALTADDPRREFVAAVRASFRWSLGAVGPTETAESIRSALRKSAPGSITWVPIARLLVEVLATVTDGASAMELLDLLAELAAAGPIGASDRARAALAAAGALMVLSDERAADAYAMAVAALATVTWLGLDRRSRELQLAELPDVGPQAAAAALRHGDASTALQLLEQGRGVLWSQQLRLRPRDAGRLESLGERGRRILQLAAALKQEIEMEELSLPEFPVDGWLAGRRLTP